MTDFLGDLTFTSRAVLYLLAGFAMLVLTVQPWFSRFRLANLPLLYVLLGVGLGALGLPVLNPLFGEMSARIIEHSAELIVLISLAGAGLAIDTRESWHEWQAAIRLVFIAMPLTILSIALLGIYLTGLPLASAILLAAVLAPTDPVLARSVQVSPPGKGETPMEVSLTAEAGLNDGLAFPFVYLAIAFAAASGDWTDWGWTWLGWDFLYRVSAGYAVGVACGWALARLVYSRFGDAQAGAWNALVVVLATTFISYGAAELVQGYGFLAVFAAARKGRAVSQARDGEYARFVHRDADQIESVLLVMLLTWFGMFLTTGVMEGLTGREVLLAALILLILRPVAGLLSLLGLNCDEMSRLKVAFFGIRGMGTVFYLAYAQNHADFAEIDTLWRIAAVTITGSILIHGFASNFVLDADEEVAEGAPDPDHKHPHKAREAGE